MVGMDILLEKGGPIVDLVFSNYPKLVEQPMKHVDVLHADMDGLKDEP